MPLNPSRSIPKCGHCLNEISIVGVDKLRHIFCESCNKVLTEDSEIDSPYYAANNEYHYICKCPQCDILVLTDKCGCMCGNCERCGYEWDCLGYNKYTDPNTQVTFVYPTSD